MNRALLWWSLGIIVIILLVTWGFSRSDKQDPDGFGALPWIEVVANEVFVDDADGQGSFVAQTGDELPNGAIISTSATGAARIHFPDGSFARLDPNSELTITTVSFDPKNDELLVRMMLASGSVWSKVVSLATADSLWEVRTSQAVAAVRGTAFGVEAKTDTDTRIIGIEDEVSVTHGDEEIIVTPNTEMSMRNGVMSDLLALRDDMKNNKDYKTFVEEKEAFDGTLEQLKGAYKSEREWRKALRQQKIDAFRDAMRDARENRRPASQRGERTTDDEQETGNNNEQHPVVPVEPVPQRGALRIEIVPERPLGEHTEGEQLGFRAFVVSTAGERKDVTAEASWYVVGDIGMFEAPGLFRAELKPELREYGTWPGGVSVKFKDLGGSSELEGATQPFMVKTFVPPVGSTRGQ